MQNCSWRARNHINLRVGQRKRRILPVVVHILQSDLDWFNQDSDVLAAELLQLLKEKVIRPSTVVGPSCAEKDPEGSKTRKRARQEEQAVQGVKLQFTYRYRPTQPHYTALTYGARGGRGEGGFSSAPVSQSTLMVWVFRFDPENPYAPLPTETFESLPITSYFKYNAGQGGAGQALLSAVDRDKDFQGMSAQEREDVQRAIAMSLAQAGEAAAAKPLKRSASSNIAGEGVEEMKGC